MSTQSDVLKERTHAFFVRVIALCEALPETAAAQSISSQLLDAAGSTDSNYRAACRARSKKEFVAKIGVAAEEADESLGWLQSLRDAGISDGTELAALLSEADELTRILVKSHKTAEFNLKQEERKRRRHRS